MKKKNKYGISEGGLRISKLNKKEILALVDKYKISYCGEEFGVSNVHAARLLLIRARELKIELPKGHRSKGRKEINDLSKEEFIEIMSQEKYLEKASKRFRLSHERVSYLFKLKINELGIFVGDSERAKPFISYPKHPFSTNEDDYGTSHTIPKWRIENTIPEATTSLLSYVVQRYKQQFNIITPNF